MLNSIMGLIFFLVSSELQPNDLSLKIKARYPDIMECAYNFRIANSRPAWAVRNLKNKSMLGWGGVACY